MQGEYGNVVVAPGIDNVLPAFQDRGLPFSHDDEFTTPYLYRVTADAGQGKKIITEHTATSRVGFLRFLFNGDSNTIPHVVIQATRANFTGCVNIDLDAREISGENPERQDSILGPFRAINFRGYFVARFDIPFQGFGTATSSLLHPNDTSRIGDHLAAYARFPPGTKTVQVRVATSFISVEQARRNLDNEIPDGTPFETVVRKVKAAWAEKLDRVEIKGATHEQLVNFYTGMYREF